MTRHKTQGIIFDYKIAAKSGYLVSRMYIMILGSKGLLPPTRCLRIAQLQSNSRNSINIWNPHIYCVNSYFLMFSGSQVQMSYLASKNDILNFSPWHHHTRFCFKKEPLVLIIFFTSFCVCFLRQVRCHLRSHLP